MAWYGYSPVDRVGDYCDQQEAPAYWRSVLKGIWQFISNLPLLSNLLERRQVSFVHKELALLKYKIHTKPLDTTSEVVAILEELQRLKKNFAHLIGDRLNGEVFLSLQKLAKRKSYASIREDEPLEQEQMQGPSNHKTILERMQQKRSEAVHLTQTMPTILHWRYAANGISEQNYGAPRLSFPQAKTVRLNMSATKLIELLKNPHRYTTILPSAENFQSDNENLLCGISLTFTPKFDNESPNGQQPSFWQNQPSKINVASDMADHIDEIFFENHDHYAEFKEMIQHETTLQKLIFDLECRQQIKFHQSFELSSPTFKA